MTQPPGVAADEADGVVIEAAVPGAAGGHAGLVQTLPPEQDPVVGVLDALTLLQMILVLKVIIILLEREISVKLSSRESLSSQSEKITFMTSKTIFFRIFRLNNYPS